MARDGRARAADVLHERDARVRNLVGPRSLPELQACLYDLITAARADGVTPRLEASERRQWQLAAQPDAFFVRPVEVS